MKCGGKDKVGLFTAEWRSKSEFMSGIWRRNWTNKILAHSFVR